MGGDESRQEYDWAEADLAAPQANGAVSPQGGNAEIARTNWRGIHATADRLSGLWSLLFRLGVTCRVDLGCGLAWGITNSREF